jgi:hypothetical protein
MNPSKEKLRNTSAQLPGGVRTKLLCDGYLDDFKGNIEDSNE